MMKKFIFFMSLCLLFAMTTVGWAQGLITPSPTLPPDGEYVSPLEYHEYAALGIVLDDPSHRAIINTAIRTPIGPDEIEEFDSVFSATEIGLGAGSIILTGPVTVLTAGKVGNTTGTFDTEIVSMSLSGDSPMGIIMIREDPSRSSVGSTTITDLGGGLYHIDSFFDVFTELSPDGGNSWLPSDSSTRMTLIPEPASLALIGLFTGGLWFTRRFFAI